MDKYLNYLKPPVYDGDEEKSRKAWLLNILIAGSFVGALIYLLFAEMERLPILVLVFILLGTLWLAMRRGYIRFSSYAIIFGLSIILGIG